MNLHIAGSRRVGNLSVYRRNLVDTCTSFVPVNINATSLSRAFSISDGIPMARTIPIRLTNGCSVTASNAGVAGVSVLLGRSGLRTLGRRVSGLNVANVAMSRMLNYNTRGNGTRCCHNITVRDGLLPGVGIRVMIYGIPMGTIISTTIGTLCANRVNSNGVFVCSIRSIIGIEANRANCSTVRSIRWSVMTWLACPFWFAWARAPQATVTIQNILTCGYLTGVVSFILCVLCGSDMGGSV